MIATSAFNELISLFIDYLAYFYPIYKLPSQLNRVFLGALLLLKKYRSKPNFLACEVLKFPQSYFWGSKEMSFYMVRTLKFGETFQKYKYLFFIAFKVILCFVTVYLWNFSLLSNLF